MAEPDLVLHASRMITQRGEVGGSVVVAAGTVVAILPYGSEVIAQTVVHLPGDVVLMPGLVDTHVHVNDPGRSDWEGFASATRAAAAGGVTTLVDMPLNSIPPTVDIAALAQKQRAARGEVYVDVGFWGGAVPDNWRQLGPLHEAGVLGFKGFLAPSGVDEFGSLSYLQLEQVMGEVRSFDGLLAVHAEDAATLVLTKGSPSRHYADFLASRPRAAEHEAIRRTIELSRSTGCRVHIVHLSSSGAVPMIAAARADGVRVTAETCPHYLVLAAEDVPEGGTEYKCCPPIREAANRGLLWEALRSGVVDAVVSDHSPSPVALKALDTGDFSAAWGGIASLQLGLPVAWTEARSRGFGLADVSRWMSESPARLARIPSKGRLESGYDADLVAFAPDEPFVVDAATLHHRHPLTPYEGRELTGVVQSCWLRGQRIDLEAPPRGNLLRRARL